MTTARYAAVVIGASAGGTKALQQILPHLPGNFPMPIIIVQHLHPWQQGAAIVYHHSGSQINIKDADEKEMVRPGFIYFAPPNYHLLVERDFTLSLSIDPRVNYTRPSVDVLFESAADAYKASLIGIVLSGANNDGAAGLSYIKKRGGLAIVQTPADAEVDYMPRSAIEAAQPEHILTAAEICVFLSKLAES